MTNDGSANAPAGTPQLPNLLNGYAVRPPWEVAGVDYAVGIPAGTVLKDPSTINIPGVSVNASSHLVYVTGNNVTLNGYDFSLHGGYSVVVEGANDTVENSNFAVGSSGQGIFTATPSASNVTFEYNVVNGNGSTYGANQTELVFINGATGRTTIEYNSIKNPASDPLSIAMSSINKTGSFIVAYNLVEGGGQVPYAHADLLQIESGTFTNAQVLFNTAYVNSPPQGTQGWQLEGNAGSTWIDAATVANNTTIAVGTPTATGGTTLAEFTGITAGTANPGTVNINNNYLDPTSMGELVRDLSTPPLSVSTNNYDMRNGDIISPNGTESASGGVPQQPPPSTGVDSSGPKISSVAESPSSGDLNAGKTVTLKLNLNGAVTVTGGTPTLTLNDGGTATYSGGSGTNALTFSYTVANGQNTSDLTVTAVNLNAATVHDGAGNAADLSLTGVTQSGPQIDTTAPTGSSPSPTPTGSSGSPAAPTITSFSPDQGTPSASGGYTKAHKLTLSGTAVANSEVEVFDRSTRLGTATVGSRGAWTYATPTLSDGTHDFTAKDVNSAGNVSAASPMFDVTVVSPASLTKTGNTYDITAAASDPVLKYKGAGVIVSEFRGWTPIGAVKTASGFDVAWKNTRTNQYTVWTTDNNGNYTGNLIGTVSANSTQWTSIAPIFPQTVNSGGTDPTTKLIQKDGSTSLTEIANHYNLDGSGSDPTLKYKGRTVTVGEFGKWTPIGAVQTAKGYDVAWKNTGSGQYTVWSTDRNGNYKGSLTGGAVSRASHVLEALEPVFKQDLNGDGVIGLTARKVVHKASKTPQLVIQKDGSTSLIEVAHRFYLDGRSGSGPALEYHGNNVTAGEFGKWTPIGAVQTAKGYDVAWKNTGTGQYTVWSTDSNGNYKGNLTGGAVSRTSSALESLEPVFHQDLNRDGAIGLYVRPGSTLTINQALAAKSESAIIGRGATLELTAADSASVTFAGSTGTLRLDHSSTFSGKISKFGGNGSLSGSDHIDLRDVKYSSVHDSYSNGVLTVTDGHGDTAKLSFDGSYSLANFKFANDGSGGTIVYDPPAASSKQTADVVSPASIINDPSPIDAISRSATTATADLPRIAFDVESMLGNLPDRNQAGSKSLPDAVDEAKIALLGNYMASMFATNGSHTGITSVAEVPRPNDHSVLSSPSHA